jgi:hypothetical protein
MANSILARMAVMISANTAELNKGLKDVSGQLKGFGSQLQGIAGTIGVAFGVREVLAFGLEVSKLAGEAEAVRTAFERLPNSIRLMNELKQATGGTVSELELMKRAVQASNFDISLEALPRLLQFATLRAQQTGQSVNYLVDSIVTGIGRKSKLILDNLGISASQLSAELNGVSTEAATVGQVAEAVGRIAEKNLVNMAGFSENAATKMQRLNAEWENLKVRIGESANGTGFFGRVIDALTSLLSEDLSRLNSIMAQFSGNLGNGSKHLVVLKNILIDIASQGKVSFTDQYINIWIEKLGLIGQKAKDFKKELLDVQRVADASSNVKDEATLEAEALAHRNKVLGEAARKQIEVIDTITEYNDAIKKLTEQNQKLTLSDRAKIEANAILIEQYEKQKKVLEDLAIVPFRKRELPSIPSIHSTSSLSEHRQEGIIMPDKVGIDGTGIEETLETVRSAAAEVNDIQLDLSSSTADFVTSMAETIGASLGGNMNFGKGFLKAVANFGKQFGAQLIALGFAKIAFDVAMGEPYAAIAAGAALVAVSTAIGASIKSFNSGNISSGSVSGRGGAGISNNSSRSIGANQTEQKFYGELLLRGSNLVAVVSNASQDNKLRRGR